MHKPLTSIRLLAALAALTFLAGGCDFITNASKSTPGNQPSGVSLSDSGRFVAFGAESAQGSDLVAPNGRNAIFVRDLRIGTVTGISRPISGAPQGDAFEPRISGDGRVVAYTALDSNLVPNDTNDAFDIFVRAVDGTTTRRLSQSAAGVGGNDNSSGAPSLSRDGNLVAFDSFASNLVPGDTNGTGDVFVANVSTNTLARITGARGGESPAISADGRFVAYVSQTATTANEIFVHELATGTVTPVSVDPAGVERGLASFPSISADGRFVTFNSVDSRLGGVGTGTLPQIYRRDVQTGTTTWVSVARDGGPPRLPDGSVTGAVASQISGTGRVVLFSSMATNMSDVSSPGQGRQQVYVRDVASARTTFASADSAGIPADGFGAFEFPTGLSGDGRYVGFISGSNLVTGEPVDDITDVYVRYSIRADVRTVAPSTVARGTSTTVTLNGAGFLGQATVAVSASSGGGNAQVSNVTVTANSVTFTLTVPANANTGKRDVVVTNIGTGPGETANSVSTCTGCLTIT